MHLFSLAISTVSSRYTQLPAGFLLLCLTTMNVYARDNDNVYLQPEGLPDLRKYHLSQVVTTTGKRTIYVSGQTARAEDGNPVGGNDLEKQMVQVLKNIQTALAAAGATMQDIVRLEIYMVDWHQDKLPAYNAAMNKFFVDPSRLPANTLIGVEALSFPHWLVEITATAVVDE